MLIGPASSVKAPERHDLVILGPDVRCSCGRTYDCTAWGPQLGHRLAHAHLARPSADTPELLAFVEEVEA